MIPLTNTFRESSVFRDQLREAAAQVIDSGTYLLGPETQAFEEEFADYVGAKYAVGVSSGIDALLLTLKAALGSKKQIGVPPLTDPATWRAIYLAGHRPVFVDVDPNALVLDPRCLYTLGQSVDAVVPVHLFGWPTSIESIGQYFLGPVIADASHCPTRDVAKDTLASTFSLSPDTPLGALGDAGIVATNDEGLRDTLRKLRNNRPARKYPGGTCHLDEIQAAMLRVKLRYLGEILAGRRAASNYYISELGLEPPSANHAITYFTLRVPIISRDLMVQFLQRSGIGAAVPYKLFPANETLCPVSAQAQAQLIQLPLWANIKRSDQDAIVMAITEALERL